MVGSGIDHYRFGAFALRRGFAFGGVVIALSTTPWFLLAADIAAVVHMEAARLAQDSHRLMAGFFIGGPFRVVGCVDEQDQSTNVAGVGAAGKLAGSGAGGRGDRA